MNQYQDSVDGVGGAGSIESLAQLEATPQGKLEHWSDEITAAEAELKKFWETAWKVQKRYLDERDAIDTSKRWFNVFHTNVGIMEASLYANIPTVDISRKFTDANDDVARVAATILQRAVQQDLAEPDCDFDQVMRQCVSDRLIPGLGTAWLRLEVETEDQPPLEDGIQPKDEEDNPLQMISHQEVCIDYVFWEDFIWSPCRVWSERRWVARKVPMTRDALTKRFGEELGKKIPLTYSSTRGLAVENTAPKHLVLKQGLVYEIWDRQSKKVIWYAKGVDQILDEKDDPLKLDHFEPCPKPLFANLTTASCIPKADYAILQDQYNELDEVNNRISMLIIACKVVGVYDRSADGIQRMLTEGYDNILIPVDNWAMFAEKGGVKGQVDWLPLDMVILALQHLQAHREAIKAQIYELTGISDIVRGSSKASETLGAQELKSKYASVRIQKLQDEVARFAEEILRIKTEILVKHFEPTILAKMSNIANTQDAMLAMPALQLIKGNAEEMEWRISIQADTMAQIDHVRVKTERTEFMNAVATFLQSAASVGQGTKELIPLMLEMLKFGVAGFKVGNDLETFFDAEIKKFNAKMTQAAAAPPPPNPKIEEMKIAAQIDQQTAMQDMQLEIQKAQQKMKQDQMEFVQNMRQDQQEFALKMQQMVEEHQLKLKIANISGVAKVAANAQQNPVR